MDAANENYIAVDGALYTADKTVLLAYPLGADVQEFSVPEGVIQIGSDLLRYVNGLQKIHLPATLETVKYLSCNMDACTLQEITVAEENETWTAVDGVLFSKDMTELFCYPVGKPGASYTIPDSVTAIDAYGFNNTNALTSLTMTGDVEVFPAEPNTLKNLKDLVINGEVPAWLDAMTEENKEFMFPADPTILVPEGTTTWSSPYTTTEGGAVFKVKVDWVLPTEYSVYENVEWYLDPTDGTLTIRGEGDMPDRWYDQYPWYKWEDDVRHLVVEEGITRFHGVEGDNAYNPTRYENLKTVSLPATLTQYDNNFHCNPAVESFAVAEGGVLYAENGILYSRVDDTVVLEQYPAGKTDTTFAVPEGVTHLGRYSVWEQDITTLTLPESLVAIEEYALDVCSIRTIHIPAGVQELDNTSLRSHTLQSITVAEDNRNYTAVDGVLFSKDMTFLHTYPKEKTAQEYRIPETVTGTTSNILKMPWYLKTLYIPASLIEIVELYGISSACSLERIHVAGDNPAWSSVNGVLFNKDQTLLHTFPARHGTSYTIPDSVTTIANCAFYGQDVLWHVTMGKNVETIDWQTNFCWYDELTGVDIPTEKVPAYMQDADAFANIRGNLTLYVPDTASTEWTIPAWENEAGVSFRTSRYIMDAFVQEEDYRNVAFAVKPAAAAWTADGVFTEGEYHTIDVKDTWISAAVADSEYLEQAKNLDFDLAMSWDSEYLYTYIRYEDPNGHYNSSGSEYGIWTTDCLQLNYAEADAAGLARLEYGIGHSTLSNKKITYMWDDYLDSGYTIPEEDFSVTVDGKWITYECRTPISAFAQGIPVAGAQYGLCYVISYGNQETGYLHTQLASGCTGFHKDAADFATITLTGDTSALKGDVTGDGKVNRYDLTLLQKYFAGYPVAVPTAAADIDENSKLTRKDVMILARYLDQWEDYDRYFG